MKCIAAAMSTFLTAPQSNFVQNETTNLIAAAVAFDHMVRWFMPTYPIWNIKSAQHPFEDLLLASQMVLVRLLWEWQGLLHYSQLSGQLSLLNVSTLPHALISYPSLVSPLLEIWANTPQTAQGQRQRRSFGHFVSSFVRPGSSDFLNFSPAQEI